MTTLKESTVDETAVKDLLAQMVAAWDANDAAAFASLYGDDASVVTAGRYVQGRDDIHAFMSAGFAGALAGTKSVEQPQQVRFVGADVAIVSSVSGYVMAGEQTVRDEMARRATWVLNRKADGGWLVESYHNCAK